MCPLDSSNSFLFIRIIIIEESYAANTPKQILTRRKSDRQEHQLLPDAFVSDCGHCGMSTPGWPIP